MAGNERPHASVLNIVQKTKNSRKDNKNKSIETPAKPMLTPSKFNLGNYRNVLMGDSSSNVSSMDSEANVNNCAVDTNGATDDDNEFTTVQYAKRNRLSTSGRSSGVNSIVASTDINEFV